MGPAKKCSGATPLMRLAHFSREAAGSFGPRRVPVTRLSPGYGRLGPCDQVVGNLLAATG